MTEDQASYGLDKDARLAAKRQKAQEEEKEPEPLDPPFPYYVLPFKFPAR